jgi:NAD-dependent DNA ligase
VGKEPGSKFQTAQRLGVKMLNESEFKEFMEKERVDI